MVRIYSSAVVSGASLLLLLITNSHRETFYIAISAPSQVVSAACTSHIDNKAASLSPQSRQGISTPPTETMTYDCKPTGDKNPLQTLKRLATLAAVL